VQLIVGGDFLQLPPIPNKKKEIFGKWHARVCPDTLCIVIWDLPASQNVEQFQTIQLIQVVRLANQDFIMVLQKFVRAMFRKKRTPLNECQRPLPPKRRHSTHHFVCCKCQCHPTKQPRITQITRQKYTLLIADDDVHKWKPVTTIKIMISGPKVPYSRIHSNCVWPNEKSSYGKCTSHAH
jgi:hypothetical protein